MWGESFHVLLATRLERGVRSVAAIRLGEMPTEIWPVNPKKVRLIIDRDSDLPKGIKVSTQAGELEFPMHAVFHPYQVDPDNPLRGLGPMQAAWRATQRYFTAERFTEALLKNGGEPGGFYTVEDGGIGPKDRRKLQDSHRRVQQDADEHRKVLVLGKGIKFETHAWSPKDLEFSKSLAWDRDTIMSVFGVTKPILGITEDVNRANSREAKAVFWENAVLPLLDNLEDEINTHFIQNIQGEENTFALFDKSDIDALQDETSIRIEDMLKLFERGGRSMEEASRIVGQELGPIEDGDKRFMPSTVVPFDQAVKGTATPDGRTPPGTPSDDDEQDQEPPSSTSSFGIELTERELTAAKGMGHQFRRAYISEWEGQLKVADDLIARRTKRVFTDFLNAKRLEIEAFAKRKEHHGEIEPDMLDAEKATRRRQVARAVSALVDKGIAKWIDEMEQAVKRPFSTLWDDQASRMAAEIGSGEFVTSTSPEALRFLKRQRIQLAEGATSTVAEQVKLAILDALAEGPQSVGSLAKRIEAVLDDVNTRLRVMRNQIPARALRIARTESTAIANGARVAEMRKDGVKKHMWADANDPFVRQSHSQLDGQIRVIGEEFGFGLRFPGDPQARVEQVANCRCATIPIPE